MKNKVNGGNPKKAQPNVMNAKIFACLRNKRN
jgi:hypothetical protein